MKLRDLSGITFGGASISGEGGGYGFGAMSEAQAEKLIRGAFEHGITLFDTAPIYGFGMSEERLGKFLPKDAMVVTKSGVDWHETKRVNMTNSPVHTERMFHESLKRLQRDCIDVYMVHWPDTKFDIREPLAVLKKYQDQGKIKHIGLCNTNLHDLNLAKEICQVEVLQSELNVLNTSAFDSLNQEWKNYFTMSWGTFDKGILTGRVTKDRKFDQFDGRGSAPWWNKKDVEVKIEKVAKLKAILSDYGISLQEFCLNFNLNHYGLSTCLIGFKTYDDIVQMTTYLQTNLTPETIDEVLIRFHNP